MLVVTLVTYQLWVELGKGLTGRSALKTRSTTSMGLRAPGIRGKDLGEVSTSFGKDPGDLVSHKSSVQ